MNLFLFTSYINYFSNSYDSITLINQQILTNFLNKGVFINNCYFSNMISSSRTVIYFTNSDFNFVIENCIFINCKCTSNIGGGTLYLSITNSGSIIFIKNCIYNCSSGNVWGQFGYIEFPNNQLYDLFSITHIKSTGSVPIQINKGLQKIININSSHHIINSYSGFYMQNSINSNFSFSTIFNITCSSYICFEIQYSTSKILNSNIINNNSPSNYGVIMASYSNLLIENTIFQKNKNTLFYGHAGGSCTVKNCWIEHPSNSYGSFTTNGINNFIFTQTYIFTHFSTNLCHGFYFSNYLKESIQYKIFFLNILI